MAMNVTKRNSAKITELAKELRKVKGKFPYSFSCNVKNPTSYVSSSSAGNGIRSSKKESSSVYGSYKKYFSNANSYIKEVNSYLTNVIVVLEGQSIGINKIDKETIKKTENNVLAKVKAGSAITKSLLATSFATTNTGATNTSSGSSSKAGKLNKIADEVISGKWGYGSDRKKKLEAAGYNYNEVQSLVNDKLSGKVTYSTTDSGTSKKSTSKKDSTKNTKSSSNGLPSFDSNGYLVRKRSEAGQKVINGILRAGNAHATHPASLDDAIDKLSPEECVWVLTRLENEGFGQIVDGYSHKSVASDRNFYNVQVVRRFGGDIHKLLKKWGTYSYTGY